MDTVVVDRSIRAKEVIDYLIDNYNFGTVLSRRTYSAAEDWDMNYINSIRLATYRDFNAEMKERGEEIRKDPFLQKFQFMYGMTKMVIIVDDCDFVIKIPFGREELDYCQREVDNYAKACDAGLSEFFAWAQFDGWYNRSAKWFDVNWGKWNGVTTDNWTGNLTIPIYLMEKVWCDDTMVSSTLSEMGYTESGGDEDDVWCLMVEICGQSVVADLHNFCTKWHINDLHSGNVGFKDPDDVTTMVFVDYSGYCIRS